MHQPCYKYPDKDYYILPWVRFHGIKDYYGMARTVDKFDKVKVTFNFSGILIRQLLDYVKGAKDYYGILTLKKAGDLTKEEKDFIKNRFFSINFDRFVRPHKRYHQLYNKKMSPAAKFTNHDIGDLQAIFNLCWFHPYTIAEDKNLRQLIKKEKDYTHDDREYIINKQYQILSAIFPLYKKLIARKKVELILTPYYHPIMPLIYDTDVLREFPYLKKPAVRFSAHADCGWHLKKAKEVFQEGFGYTPIGSWPSEGSVCEEVLSIYNDQGFKWIGADEGILFKSLTTNTVPYELIKNQRHLIYRPYNFRDVNIFFRDRNLSDAISFTYQGWEDPVFAANDLLEHFKRSHYYARGIFKERVVPIIMDGENAWEYYKNNGIEFLETVYSALEKSSILTTTTPGQFLEINEDKPLERLAAGSWINGDFGVWIGNQKNNEYWFILRKIKDLIEAANPDDPNVKEARQLLYLIEGSDWYWWNTFDDVIGEFKHIFFMYVEKIYHLLGKKLPLFAIKAKEG